MFNGRYTYSLENKGRLAIPAKFRRELTPEAEDTFVVTRGYDGGLALYPLDEWLRVEPALQKYSSSGTEEERWMARWFSGRAERVTFDSQGRIKIPQHLLDYAKLEKEVLIIGVLERIELWNPELYEKEESKLDPTKLGPLEGLHL